MTVRAGVWLSLDVFDQVGEKQKNIMFYYPSCGDYPQPLTSPNRFIDRKPSYFIVLGIPK